MASLGEAVLSIDPTLVVVLKLCFKNKIIGGRGVVVLFHFKKENNTQAFKLERVNTTQRNKNVNEN